MINQIQFIECRNFINRITQTSDQIYGEWKEKLNLNPRFEIFVIDSCRVGAITANIFQCGAIAAPLNLAKHALKLNQLLRGSFRDTVEASISYESDHYRAGKAWTKLCNYTLSSTGLVKAGHKILGISQSPILSGLSHIDTNLKSIKQLKYGLRTILRSYDFSQLLAKTKTRKLEVIKTLLEIVGTIAVLSDVPKLSYACLVTNLCLSAISLAQS